MSFWLPGLFGSLAAVPQQPGWSLTSVYYHTSVSAGADVARAREFQIGKIPVNLTANVSAKLDARADLAFALPTYTFATPIFGGQLSVGAIGIYGRVDTSLAGTVTGALATPLGTFPFSRSDSISNSVTGFGDVWPIATLKWNNGVHNYMTYMTGDIPVGAYNSARLSNIGIGHGALLVISSPPRPTSSVPSARNREGAALILPACNTEAMNLHLAEIALMVAPGAHAVLLVDQAGWHLSARLVIPTNITILPMPPKSPELNPVENIWQFMRDNWLSNRVFKSYDDLVDHCCEAWNKLVDQPWRIMSIGLRQWAHGF